MTNEQAIKNFLLGRVGCGYIYGATGWVCSLSRRKAQAEQYPKYADLIMGTGAKWDGKVCYDCAQLTRRALELIGLKPPSGATSQYKSAALYEGGGAIGQLPPGRVAQLFRVAADSTVPHTGTALGDGTAVDARGHNDGVVRMAVSQYPWTHYRLIKGGADEYTGDAAAAPETPKKPDTETPADGTAIVLQPVRLRKSMDTSSSANVLRQMGIGETALIIGIARKGAEIWANLQQVIGQYTYRGWACVEDARTRYIQLPGMALPEGQQELPRKLYMATITALDSDQVAELIKVWPQALVRDLT